MDYRKKQFLINLNKNLRTGCNIALIDLYQRLMQLGFNPQIKLIKKRIAYCEISKVAMNEEHCIIESYIPAVKQELDLRLQSRSDYLFERGELSTFFCSLLSFCSVCSDDADYLDTYFCYLNNLWISRPSANQYAIILSQSLQLNLKEVNTFGVWKKLTNNMHTYYLGVDFHCGNYVWRASQCVAIILEAVTTKQTAFVLGELMHNRQHFLIPQFASSFKQLHINVLLSSQESCWSLAQVDSLQFLGERSTNNKLCLAILSSALSL